MKTQIYAIFRMQDGYKWITSYGKGYIAISKTFQTLTECQNDLKADAKAIKKMPIDIWEF